MSRSLHDEGEPWTDGVVPRTRRLDAEALYRLLAGEPGYRGGGAPVRDPHEELQVRILAMQAENDELRAGSEAPAGCIALLVAVPSAVLVWAWWTCHWLVFGASALFVLWALVQAVITYANPRLRPRSEAEIARTRERMMRPDGRHQENLRVLFDRLSEADPEQRLLKAEVARGLGRFDDALRLIEGPPGDHPSWRSRADTIQALARAQNPWVSRVFVRVRCCCVS